MMRSAGIGRLRIDWNTPASRSAFIEASKPIYACDQIDYDEAQVNIYRASLVCPWLPCYGEAYVWG
jgi:hypothetical protein